MACVLARRSVVGCAACGDLGKNFKHVSGTVGLGRNAEGAQNEMSGDEGNFRNRPAMVDAADTAYC